MRRAPLVVGLVAALVASCGNGSSPPRHHPRATPSATPTATYVDPADSLTPEVLREPSPSPCPRRMSPPVTRPAAPWDVNGDGRGDAIVSYSGGEDRTSFDVLQVLLTSREGTAACDEPLVAHLYRFWWSASGDFDDDGYADVAYAGDLEGSGMVAVIPGGPSGLVASGTFRLSSAEFGSQSWFGRSLTVADFDRDGYDDLAIGAPQTGPIGVSSGAIVVLWGGPQGLQGTQPTGRPGRYLIRTSLREFGDELSAGDVNGDGYPDLIESADRDSYTGLGTPRLTVIPGGPNGPREPHVVGEGFGLLRVGDLTGDGIDDVAASDPARDRILLYLGGTSGLRPPEVITPGRQGLPLQPHGNGRFHALAIIPASAGRPGLLAAGTAAPHPNQSHDNIVLIPGSATGVNARAARVYPYTDVIVMQSDVDGDTRPDLLGATSADTRHTLYSALQFVGDRLRRSAYVVLPRRADPDHPGVALRRPSGQ